MFIQINLKYETLSCRTNPHPLKDHTVKAVPPDTRASFASSQNDTAHTQMY